MKPETFYMVETEPGVMPDYAIRLRDVGDFHATVELHELEFEILAQNIADIYIKWDGCSNITWHDTDCALHMCSARCYDQFALVLKMAYMHGHAMIPKGNLAEHKVDETPLSVVRLLEMEGDDEG